MTKREFIASIIISVILAVLICTLETYAIDYKFNIDIGKKKYLTDDQRAENAIYIFEHLHSYGMSMHAIAGLLGNIEQESTINSGLKSSNTTGWGLIQWSPRSVLTDWADENGLEWSDPDTQLLLIIEEGEESTEHGQWLSTKAYSYTWEEFCEITDIDEATKAYLYQRERAGTPELEKRLEYAHKWYDVISTYYVNKILRIEKERENNGTR